MKIRFSLLILMLVSTLSSQKLTAQNNSKDTIFGPYQFYTVGYLKSSVDKSDYILATFDSSTKAIYSLNSIDPIVASPKTNFSLVRDAHRVNLFATIDKNNYSDYRYRILINDTTEIVHWSTPKEEKLASLDCANKKITLQMYNINYPNEISTVYLYNKLVPKPIIGSFSYIIGYKDKEDRIGYAVQNIDPKHNSNNNKVAIESGISNSFRLIVYKNDANILYQIYVTNLSATDPKPIKVPTKWSDYGKTQDGKHPVSFSTISEYFFRKPGNYKLTVVPQLPGSDSALLFKNKAASITFKILPPQKTFTLEQIIPVVGISALILGIGFWQYKTYQNKKLYKENRQKEMTKTQLSSIRSQLNPHFMYNALAGIQNLMNKNETEKANHYLGRFSRLTRNVLEGSVNDLISVANEEILLDDYLQMEQLRFGFQYAVDIDENINRENTEIPAMLLQPFADNAVKHGIAELKSNGRIHIHFSKNDENLVIRIKDNGAGFDTGKKQDGFGLKLSQKRIALLNEVYKESRITLKMQSDENGTDVSINLHNWI